jgi:hypothetical protein
MSVSQAEMVVSQTIVDSAVPLPAGPYPGLRPFEPNEWAIFFGREPMIDEVVTRLLSRQIVVVHGSSGCGKSSLIRAGVLPRLELEHARGGIGWKTAAVRPEDRPLRNLGRALARRLDPPAQESREQPADAWHRLLVVGGACDAIERQLVAGKARLCLLIDQFEELFRYAREGGREEAELFVKLICSHAECPTPGLFIILTMRSDYIGVCAQFDGFAEQVDRCQYLLPRMDNLALLRAIREPARLFGGEIDGRVADRLLSAARREEDSLPILQHTLMRACAEARKRHRPGDGWTVTLDDLVIVAGEHGALSTHAEEVLKKATGENRELMRVAEWVFRSLADIDGEGRIVRRPCRLDELVKISAAKQEDVNNFVDAFRARDCSFLTPPPDERRDLALDTIIDVGHEALLRQWKLLSDPTPDPVTREPTGWLPREIEDRRRWQFLATMAQAFISDTSAKLPPAMTAAYQDWLPRHNQAWASRHAQQRKDPTREYDEVCQLLDASRRNAWKEWRWRTISTSLIPGIISAIFILLWWLLGPADFGTPALKNAILGGSLSTFGVLIWEFLKGVLFVRLIIDPIRLPTRRLSSYLMISAQTFVGAVVGISVGAYGFVDIKAGFAHFSWMVIIGLLGAEGMDVAAVKIGRRRPR